MCHSTLEKNDELREWALQEGKVVGRYIRAT